MIRRVALLCALAAVLAGALGAARVALTAPGDRIEAARSEGEAILAELQDLDARLELTVEAYNGASLKLSEVEDALSLNGNRLALAKESGRTAQQQLRERVVALYKVDDQTSLEVVLGAKSLTDLIDRVDTVRRISAQDRDLVGGIQTARQEIKRREGQLERAATRQEQIVADRDRRRVEIERMIADREDLYQSKKGEIDQLIAEEAARQRGLEREARRLLVAQRQERARKEAGAAEAAASPTAAPSSPDPAPSSSAAATPPPPPAGRSKYPQVVDIAMQYLGIPYLWAGASPQTGFDCSGFVMYVYGRLGVNLPHHAASQFNYGTPVSRADLQPGDLVFFNGLGHNGIYIGGGKFIHSPHTGDVVKISSLSESWYQATFVGARRL